MNPFIFSNWIGGHLCCPIPATPLWAPRYKFPSLISALTSPSSARGNSNVLSLNTHFHIPNIKNQYKMGNVYQQLVAKCGGQVFKGGGEALERCRNLCFERVWPLSQPITQSVQIPNNTRVLAKNQKPLKALKCKTVFNR